MPDLSHLWGGDLVLGPTGDLLPVDGLQRGQQRIIRRLCTNGENAIRQRVGEYLFHQDYGAGLPRYVGEIAPAIQIEGLVRDQMRGEAAVLQAPFGMEPQISTQQDTGGRLSVSIRYTDAPTASPQSLSFDVTA